MLIVFVCRPRLPLVVTQCLMCYCCLDEADKVERVLNKFAPTPASKAQDGCMMVRHN